LPNVGPTLEDQLYPVVRLGSAEVAAGRDRASAGAAAAGVVYRHSESL